VSKQGKEDAPWPVAPVPVPVAAAAGRERGPPADTTAPATGGVGPPAASFDPSRSPLAVTTLPPAVNGAAAASAALPMDPVMGSQAFAGALPSAATRPLGLAGTLALCRRSDARPGGYGAAGTRLVGQQ
jgi:hypothetical protein